MARFNVEFSEEAMATVDELAKRQNTTKAEIIRRAIALEKWFFDTAAEGSKVVVEKPDGTQRQIMKL